MSNFSYENPTFQGKIQDFIDDIEPLVNKLKQRQRAPSDVKFNDLTKTTLDDVIMLHSYLDVKVSSEEIGLRVVGQSDIVNYCSDMSFSLKYENVTIGLVLQLPLAFEAGEAYAYVYGVSVAPEYRKSWVTPLLKLETCFRAQRGGATNIRFNALKRNPDTLRHAQRVGAAHLD